MIVITKKKLPSSAAPVKGHRELGSGVATATMRAPAAAMPPQQIVEIVECGV